MKENFKIEKELKFNSNIYEVLSISLEEKHSIELGKLVGNFLISGEYKIHELSLNKERFNFKIPYEHEIKSDIDENTVCVEITDFTYDVIDGFLYANIIYDVLGNRKDILLFDDEEDLDDFLKSREVELVMGEVIDEIDDVIDIPNKKNDEVIVDDFEVEEIKNETKQKKEEISDRNIEEAKQNLLNSVKVDDDDFITYQIHIVKENDTLESILVKYNMTLEELKEYNDFSVLNLGMKLIIPVINE